VRTRHVTALLVALAVAVPATPALAAGLHHGGSAAATKHTGDKGTKPSKPSKPTKPTRPVKRVSFSYNGTLTAVDVAAGTVTVMVRGGGHQALRGKKITLAVPATAVVRRNAVAATPADLVAGDRIQVKGDRVGSAHTVRRVSATSAAVTTPAPTPSVEPTEPSETPEPTVTPTA
jgi:hypothetical protein